MTPTEWQTCTDPAAMLTYLGGRASDRKLRLFACACCRRIWHLLPQPGSRVAVEAAERFADGQIDKEELAQAEAAGKEVTWAAVQAAHSGWGAPITELARAAWVGVWAACAAENTAEAHVWTEGVLGQTWEEPTARSLAARTAQVASWARTVAEDRMTWNGLDAGPADARGEAEEVCQADLLRDLFGDGSVCPPLPSAWLRWHDGCVVKMARAIYDEGRFRDLPILADALDDAGCNLPDLLEHCRNPHPHVRGCWVLDAILDIDS
jgi:hypothetical protein